MKTLYIIDYYVNCRCPNEEQQEQQETAESIETAETAETAAVDPSSHRGGTKRAERDARLERICLSRIKE